MRYVRLAILVASLPLLAGCHSAYVEATVVNRTGAPISQVEVDYPSASFGSDTLAPNGQYVYRFKVLGEGATKVLWTDAHHLDHNGAGPWLFEHDEGRMTVTITPAGPNWSLQLTNRKDAH